MPVPSDRLSRDREDNALVKPIRFRYNIAIALAGLLGFLGAIPVATSLIGYDLDGTVRSGGTPGWAYLLLLILLVPLAVALWGWRAGTDADAAGLRLRALFGSRSVRWDEITAIVPQGRRVLATLTNGRAVALPAVTRADIPRLVAATG
jgi:hypothetical protein